MGVSITGGKNEWGRQKGEEGKEVLEHGQGRLPL